MYAVITCNPPLGAATVIKRRPGKPIHFTALLSTQVSSASTETPDVDDDYIVELWYGTDHESEWRAAKFTRAPINDVTILNSPPHTTQRYFTLALEYTSCVPLNYTIRFRPAGHTGWYWAREQQCGGENGRLIFPDYDDKDEPATSDELTYDDIFDVVPPDTIVAPALSQVPNVAIFTVSAPVIANKTEHHALGRPLLLEKYYSLVKLASPWIGPRHGKGEVVLDKDALMVGWMRGDGRHVVVMGVAVENGSGGCQTYITGGGGTVGMKTRNDGLEEGRHRVVVGVGNEWGKVVDGVMYRVREMVAPALVEGKRVEQPEMEEEMAEEEARNEKNDEVKDLGRVETQSWREEWYDGLAYCTWNGLGRELTEQRIIDALQDLHNNGINVSALIIDDNWQGLINRKWHTFEATTPQFPSGLSHTVRLIRMRFPHIRHIAVWHALFGYWDGVAPGGFVDTHYSCETIKWHGGWDVRIVSPSDVSRCYDDFYRFLRGAGIDAVKCDVQCAIDELDVGLDRERVGRAYQDALKVAGTRWFGRRVIYCMAMQPFILQTSLLGPTHLPSTPMLLRNSDDFFPHIPGSHNWHVFCNAHNNILTSRLAGIPDWDMFQSSLRPYGSMHAAARAVAGGPIYITDSPGNHNIELIRGMCAINPASGGSRVGNRTVLVRPSSVARPTDPYTAYTERRFLRITAYAGWSGRGGNSILGVFNVSDAEITEVLPVLDGFTGLVPGETYAVRAFSTGAVVGEVRHGNDDSDVSGKMIVLTLPSSGWEIFSATRVLPVRGTHASPHVYVGCLGLTDKFSGAAAVLDFTVQERPPAPDGNRLNVNVQVTLKALGVLGFYVSDLPEREVDGMLVLLEGRVVPVEVMRKGTGMEGTVLFVDVERAWTQLAIVPGWSNSVGVVLML